MSLLHRARDLGLNTLERSLEWSENQVGDALRVTRFLKGKAAFEARPDDVYVVTYPRSGTTWVQFILYLMHSDQRLDFAHLSEVSPWWERSLALGSHTSEDFAALEGPRVFKSHLPRRWLPGQGRFVCVVRDGLDVAVSFYHLYRSHIGFTGSFEAFFDKYLRGDVQYGGYHKHVAGWQKYASDPDVLMLEYEALRADPAAHVRKLADFLGWPLSAARLDEVVEKSSFAAMKANEDKFDPITETVLNLGLRRGSFLRSGKTGEGRAKVSEEMAARFRADAERVRRRPELEARLAAFLH